MYIIRKRKNCTGTRNENENDPVPGGSKSEERSTTTENDSVHCGSKSLTRRAIKPWCEMMVELVGWWNWKPQKRTR